MEPLFSLKFFLAIVVCSWAFIRVVGLWLEKYNISPKFWGGVPCVISFAPFWVGFTLGVCWKISLCSDDIMVRFGEMMGMFKRTTKSLVSLGLGFGGKWELVVVCAGFCGFYSWSLEIIDCGFRLCVFCARINSSFWLSSSSAWFHYITAKIFITNDTLLAKRQCSRVAINSSSLAVLHQQKFLCQAPHTSLHVTHYISACCISSYGQISSDTPALVDESDHQPEVEKCAKIIIFKLL